MGKLNPVGDEVHAKALLVRMFRSIGGKEMAMATAQFEDDGDRGRVKSGQGSHQACLPGRVKGGKGRGGGGGGADAAGHGS